MSQKTKQETEQYRDGYFATFKIGLPDEYRSTESEELHNELNIAIMKALEPIIYAHPEITLTHNLSVESLEPTRLI